MPERVCCVRNCDFNPGDKENRKTIFQFCEKSPYFKTWMNAIGPNLRDGKKTRKNYYICERHFDDGNLHRIPMNILKDGKEVTLLRRRPMLKSTSVPYIFPGSRLIDSNNLESSSIIDSNNLPMECTLENTWRDTKTKVSNKVTSLKKNRAATGNKPNDIVLTERDKKIIDLIGHEYFESLATVPDSIPEEFENVFEQLEQGLDVNIDEVIPQVITVQPVTVPAEENINDELLPIISTHNQLQ
ncbi:PREDICTED: uncharacterized protein LOC108767552 [Trachymyrmex cornetzi]|uniref:uncharacterized protein LOC108767552 n=1 Tax=Trachymyrmex cornetzi TaxID=471704 RepID=UPI00084F247A|nr:PREDICTED: uncharacterized protein LOC108767552 [Trachymyrmex cornetzi]